MRKLFFFLFLFSGVLYGQEKKFTISGVVTDCKTKEAISGVIIKVIGKDKSSVETKSDSEGRYSFENFKSGTDYILTTIIENSTGRGKPIKCGVCPYAEYSGKGYFDPSEKFKFIPDSTNIEHDICLSSQMCDMRILPDFYFKKNSTDFSYINWVGMSGQDTILDCIAQMLVAQNTWVFEISAHSSNDEDDKLQLSKDRAKKIYKLLIERGIEPGRLKSRGYSDKHPIEFTNDYGEVIQKSQDETNEKSRRVVFGILRKDYLPMKERHNTISGVVSDCKNRAVIPSVTIKLVGSDGSSIETKTNTNGYYLFDSSMVNLNTQYVVTTQIGVEVTTANVPRGYLNSSDKVKLNITTSSERNTIVDFCLAPNFECVLRLPEFRFTKNSATNFYSSDSLDDLNFAYQVLIDNPTFVIELGGHASKDEKNPDKLGQKRAQLIKDLLVKRGISQERVIVKSYSDTIYNEYLDEQTYEIKIYDKDDEQSYKMNRRVGMSIIRKDYIPKNPPKEQPPKNTEDLKGE